ncbi:YlxR family protein [Desulfohalobium retbaense]|uniref:YlxR domain-containing protein n=1 Tax=Desulfohalobium retbaense (strain ATCC 49708 / DSM 5692 / JCM 16813 / HR100) TaxID=485915 RepID=C8X0G8_DESRD|nr:protein of unknown function DUF448 [Desulfohalobium retbaense DSM 5692]
MQNQPVNHSRQHGHQPERMCVICRRRFAKHQLHRLVASADCDRLLDDPKQTRPGRGYYICPDPACQKRISKFRGWRKKCKGGRHDN